VRVGRQRGSVHFLTGQQDSMRRVRYGAGLYHFLHFSVYFLVLYFILLSTFVVNKCYIDIMPILIGQNGQ